MKDKDYRVAQLKRKLLYYKNNRKKFLDWKISKEDADLIQYWGYRVEAYLYEINTKKLTNIRLIKSSLLKDVHYNYKRGKRKFVSSLTQEEKQLLTDNGVHYKVAKSRIYLR